MDNNSYWTEESQFGSPPGLVQDLNALQNNDFLEQHDSSNTAVQEKDSEALSSLLMLSKANPEPNAKQNEAEVHANPVEYQNRGLVAPSSSAMINNRPAPTASQSQMQQTLQNQQIMKRMAMAPTTERSLRGESNQPLSKTVKIEDLRRFFHLPIVEVTRQLGTCTTALKKICRRNKISKWPYRQIRSITKSIQSLEMASLNDTLNEDLRIQYREQIVTLQNAIDDVIRDPNKVVTLVNMGLTEDMVKAAERGGGAVGGGAGGAALGANGSTPGAAGGVSGSSSMMRGQSAVGVGGVLNMMAWPKPSADVQQIMLAASAHNNSSSANDSSSSSGKGGRTFYGGGGAAGSSSGVKRKSEAQQQQHGGDDFDHVLKKPFHHPEGANASSGVSGGYLVTSGGEISNDGFDLDVSSPGRGFLNKENSLQLNHEGGSSSGGGGSAMLLDGKGLLGDDALSLSGDDVTNLLSGDMQDNLRHKVVDIGLTLVQCDLNLETQRLQFSGPVQLAPLQRKKLRPNVSRKVVPLMEPDIGSNFSIEFIPQFIVDIVQATMVVDKSLLEGRLEGVAGTAAATTAVSGAGGEGTVVNVNSITYSSASQLDTITAASNSTGIVSEDHHNQMPYGNIMDAIDSEELDRLINHTTGHSNIINNNSSSGGGGGGGGSTLNDAMLS